MSAPTILITGAASGIGRAGAVLLGRRGWRVLVHARNDDRGRPVLEALRAEVPGGTFDLVTADLADLGQVRSLADQTNGLTGRLDVLWNNAGMMTTKPRVSAQGFEMQWAVNHLAPFVLTRALLPLVQRSAGGRVILTSSFAHHVGRVPENAKDFEAPPSGYNGWITYGSTKLANILFVRELARRSAGTGLTAHAFHPGYVRTDFGANGEPGKGNAGSWLSFVQVPPEKGAETGVFLATSEEAASGSGRYWSSCRPRKGSGRITEANAAVLWDHTETALESQG